jgi:methyl-accepting chemotaxis protein
VDTFRNMTIGARLGIGFGVLVALCVTSALGVAGMSRIGAGRARDQRRLSGQTRLTRSKRMPGRPLSLPADTCRRPNSALYPAQSGRQGRAGWTRHGELDRLTPRRSRQGPTRKIEVDRKAYLDTLAQVMTLAETGKVVQGEAAVHQTLEPRFSALARSVGSLVAQNKAQAARSGEAHMAAIGAARWTSGLLWLISLGGGTLFAWWLVRSLTVPLAQAVSAAQRISAGQLDVQIETQGKDEVAQLLGALASMQAELRAMIGDVARSAAEVSTAASQLACTAGESTARAQVRSEATGSTAAAIEQMTVSIGQVAEHAQAAAAIAGRSSQLAREGELSCAASSEMNSRAVGQTRLGSGRDAQPALGRDQLDRQGDQGYRRPDQPARAECGDRGGARRGAGARIRRRRRRSAQAR